MDESNLSPEELLEAKRLQEIAERAERKAAERRRLEALAIAQDIPSNNGSDKATSTAAGSHTDDDWRNNNSSNGRMTEEDDKNPVFSRKTSKRPYDDLDNAGRTSSHNRKENSKAEGVKFLSKKEREELALKKLQEQREEQERLAKEREMAHENFITGRNLLARERELQEQKRKEMLERQRRENEEKMEVSEYIHEVQAIKEHYLGGAQKKKRIIKPSEKFTKLFQFDWEQDDDTTRSDMNPLYQNRVKINALFGRGYIAGIDQREQRKDSNFLNTLSEKRSLELKMLEEQDDKLTEEEKRYRQQLRQQASAELKKRQEEEANKLEKSLANKLGRHWTEKSLEEMTDRDWRIFREDFDIHIQGGRATLPLRYWSEAGFPSEVMKAIEYVKYDTPSPIQRQAIPVGLAGRDIIGIAETGSGKTAAFLIPMLCYMMKLPPLYINRCAEQGPLAVVMAPTRELAQQIDDECKKLSKFSTFKSVCVVGGQDIEDQGYQLRRGVEIVIGTPGRMVDCLENNYMVLNQCNYVVLDEADRMVDMGFEPQVVAVLDAMGGLLKSEDENQAEKQVLATSEGKEVYRVTAMFSATMPLEVERIAKTYLRHPVMIRIGDEDTGKNKRIDQRVQVLASEAQKKSKLMEELSKLSKSDKIIVFINSKKQCDVIGRYLDTSGYHAGVLHGGKSQDQREETLDYFRNGTYQILVASDVAARGLDIPDVTFVVNYDCPAKIENYTHRIGRTGRAGKTGVATTFITDADADIMYDLKNYLEATNMPVPHLLANHPSAQAPVGSRDDKGKLVGTKKDSIQYSKK